MLGITLLCACATTALINFVLPCLRPWSRMRRPTRRFAALFAWLLVALPASLIAAPAAPAASVTGPDTEARVIVRFKPQADSVRAKALALRATRLEAREVAQTRGTALGLRHGRQLDAGISLDERTHVYTASGMSSAALARELAADPEVELVAVDGRRKHYAVLPNDPLFGGAQSDAPVFIGRFLDAGTRTTPPQLRDTYSRQLDQWYLKAPSTKTNPNGCGQGAAVACDVVSSINAPAAWGVSTGMASVVVAVLDTGIRRDHPDFTNLDGSIQILSGYDMIGSQDASKGATAEAIANRPANADRTLALDYGDWVSQADLDKRNPDGTRLLGSGCGTTDIANSSWHGTRVSGLIAAASNNGLGMAGVAWRSKLLPVRVLGKCGGYDSDIVAGMLWAAGIYVPGLPLNQNKAKVLNLSLGGSGTCDPNAVGTTPEQRGTASLYRDTISKVNDAGSIIVVAAGNSAGQAVGLPGNCPGVITVAALRHVGTKVGFSSVGKEVTISAPGGNCVNLADGYPCLYPMVSTTNRGTTSPVLADDAYTGTAASVGTSFSAPIVSGVIALMSAVRPTLTAPEVTKLLQRTARPFPKTGGGSSDEANPPECVAPRVGVDQLECYCTTSTCGAGMIDAAAAVAAAQALNGATVSIAASPASGLRAGETQSLTASITGLASGRSVAGTAWSVVDGGGIVTGFASGANAATATLTPSAAGSFTVRATVTDDLGLSYSQTTTISVAAVPVPVTTPPPTSAGSAGGGGAMSAAWLGLLTLAAGLLPRRRSVLGG